MNKKLPVTVFFIQLFLLKKPPVTKYSENFKNYYFEFNFQND